MYLYTYQIKYLLLQIGWQFAHRQSYRTPTTNDHVGIVVWMPTFLHHLWAEKIIQNMNWMDIMNIKMLTCVQRAGSQCDTVVSNQLLKTRQKPGKAPVTMVQLTFWNLPLSNSTPPLKNWAQKYKLGYGNTFMETWEVLVQFISAAKANMKKSE